MPSHLIRTLLLTELHSGVVVSSLCCDLIVLILWNSLGPALDLLYGLGCLRIPITIIFLCVFSAKVKEEKFSFSVDAFPEALRFFRS